MDELASTEFRKTYAKLKKPTTVTVNGHVIGQWIPGLLPPPPEFYGNPDGSRVITHSTQAQRDDLLRKINRSKQR